MNTAPALQSTGVVLLGITDEDILEIMWRFGSVQQEGLGGVAVDYHATATLLAIANAISFDPGDTYVLWAVRSVAEGPVLGAISLRQWSRDNPILDFTLFDAEAGTRPMACGVHVLAGWAKEALLESGAIQFECETTDTPRICIATLCGMRPLRITMSPGAAQSKSPRITIQWEFQTAPESNSASRERTAK